MRPDEDEEYDINEVDISISEEESESNEEEDDDEVGNGSAAYLTELARSIRQVQSRSIISCDLSLSLVFALATNAKQVHP
jgi:hypothetical protein